VICPVFIATSEEVAMRRTEWRQETRMMRFEEAYGGWRGGRLSQEEAARLLGVGERTFRRHIDRYEEEGLQGLLDKRLSQVSHRRAPGGGGMGLGGRDPDPYKSCNVSH